MNLKERTKGKIGYEYRTFFYYLKSHIAKKSDDDKSKENLSYQLLSTYVIWGGERAENNLWQRTSVSMVSSHQTRVAISDAFINLLYVYLQVSSSYICAIIHNRKELTIGNMSKVAKERTVIMVASYQTTPE